MSHRFAQAFFGAMALAAIGLGCSGSSSQVSKEARAVYFCRESRKLVVAAVQPTPAVNPATGRRTLVRALYCPQCKAWRAVPPDAAAAGNPLATKCPKHRCPLTADGPLPEE